MARNDLQGIQAGLSQVEGLDMARERNVGWAAGAVFLVWVGVFLVWIFLAPPASTSSLTPQPGWPVSALDATAVPQDSPAPSPTIVQVTRTSVPAVGDLNPTEIPTLVPSPTATPTVSPATPVPRQPEVLTLFEEDVRTVTGMGNMIYLGIRDRVVALDVTDPTFPVWIGEAGDLPGTVEQLALVSEHIYAMHPAGVSVLDVSEPGDLLQVGYFEMDPGLMDLVPGSDRLYGPIAASQGSALQVYSIGDPQALRQSGSTAILDQPVDFKAAGGYGYLTHGSRLSILDLEDPGDIQLVGTYEFPGMALAVAPNRSYAFVGVAGSGIHVLGLGNPDAPDLVSVYPLAVDPVSMHALYDGVLVALTETRVALFDASQPEALQPVGEMSLPGRLQDLQLTDEIAFVALGESGMVVIDLSQ